MDESNNNEGVEVEAPPTFCRIFGGAVENNNSKDDSIDQLPDTTDDDIESDWGAPSSSNQQGKQHTCSNVKFFILLLAAFGVFLGIGIGIGRPVGNHIYGDDETSTSNSMASAVGASDHADKTTRRSHHSKTSKETRSSDDTDTPVDVSI